MKLKALLSCATLLFALSASGAVPNSFSDGETISAAKINANFAANAKRYYLLANSQVIGQIMQFDGMNLTAMSDKLYYVNISSWSTPDSRGVSQDTTYYSGSGCTGEVRVWSSYPGRITTDGSYIWYTPLGSTASSFSYSSSRSSGSCTANTGSGTLLTPAYQNDPSVTGIPSGALPLGNTGNSSVFQMSYQ